MTPRSLRPRSRRLAFVAAVLVVGLGACGSEKSARSGASPTPSAAVPATGVPTTIVHGPKVIEVSGGPAAAPSADGAVAEASTVDTKMMAANLEFVYDGEITDLTAPAASWYFAPGESPTAEQVAAVAAVFGVGGVVHRLPPDQGGGWVVGADDGTGPSVTVGSDAMQSWWFSPGYATVSEPSCALYPAGDPAGDPTTAEMPECEPTPPPVNVPTKEQAEAKTVALLEQLGADPADYVLETYTDDWSANVNGFLVLDGARSNVSLSLSFGEEGVISWASGFLGTPQRGDDYPRIGIEAAIERLNLPFTSWRGSGGIEPLVVEQPAAPPDSGVTAGSAVATGSPDATGSSAGDTPVVDDGVSVAPPPCDPAADCVPTDQQPTDQQPIDQEPIVIHLSNARPSLEQLWAADGTVWILPGYAFDSADQGVYSVIAVEDQYLLVTEPTPVPAPTPVPEPIVDSVPIPGATVVDGTVLPEPPMTTLALPDPATLVGLSVEEAAKVVESTGYSLRVVREDGVDAPVTADYSATRLNVAVEAGVVTEFISIG